MEKLNKDVERELVVISNAMKVLEQEEARSLGHVLEAAPPAPAPQNRRQDRARPNLRTDKDIIERRRAADSIRQQKSSKPSAPAVKKASTDIAAVVRKMREAALGLAPANSSNDLDDAAVAAAEANAAAVADTRAFFGVPLFSTQEVAPPSHSVTTASSDTLSKELRSYDAKGGMSNSSDASHCNLDGTPSSCKEDLSTSAGAISEPAGVVVLVQPSCTVQSSTPCIVPLRHCPASASSITVQSNRRAAPTRPVQARTAKTKEGSCSASASKQLSNDIRSLLS